MLTVHPFHVVEEKTQKSSSFCKSEKTFKLESLSNFDKDRTDVLAARDRGSYFEQEKLIAQGRGRTKSMGEQDR